MPDGRRPEPGGWNRLVLEVRDLPARVDEMKGKGIRFRNEIVVGPGGKQILLEDPRTARSGTFPLGNSRPDDRCTQAAGDEVLNLETV
jgi:hypothetical protein